MNKNPLKIDKHQDPEIINYQLKQVKYYLNLISIKMMKSISIAEMKLTFAQTAIYMDRALLISKEDHLNRLHVSLIKLNRSLKCYNYKQSTVNWHRAKKINDKLRS